MNLREFTPKNVPTRTDTIAYIGITRAGRFNISRTLSDEKRLTTDHSARLFFEEETGTWYVAFSYTSDGFMLKEGRNGQLYFQSSFMARKVNPTDKTAKFRLGEDFEHSGYSLCPLIQMHK